MLLRELFRSASVTITAPDDPSGVNTKWLVDHEQLMANIEDEIEHE